MTKQKNSSDDYVLVYSSDGSAKNLLEQKKTSLIELPPVNPAEHTLKLRLESQGRGGKPVLVIYNIPNHPTYMKELLKRIKNLCACGGTYKPDQLEIQGPNHKEKVRAFLEKEGFKVKG